MLEYAKKRVKCRKRKKVKKNIKKLLTFKEPYGKVYLASGKREKTKKLEAKQMPYRGVAQLG